MVSHFEVVAALALWPPLLCLLPLLGLPLALLLGLLALAFGFVLALPFEPLAFLFLPLEPVLLGLPLPVLLLGLLLEGFLLLPVAVPRGGGGQAALDLGHRTLDGVALGVAQGALHLLPFVV